MTTLRPGSRAEQRRRTEARILDAAAIILGVTVSRHLVKSDDLATADPGQVISLLRPCLLALATPAAG
jgi:hypothetical protein